MTSSATTISVTSTPSAHIMSHQQFNIQTYENNINYIIILTDLPADYDLIINYVYMSLGVADSRAVNDVKDKFTILNADSNNQLYVCGDADIDYLLSVNISTHSYDSLIFLFVTNEADVFNGFLLQYSGKFHIFFTS